MEQLYTIIENLGFPIAISCAIIYLGYRILKMVFEMIESHMSDMRDIMKADNENTARFTDCMRSLNETIKTFMEYLKDKEEKNG